MRDKTPTSDPDFWLQVRPFMRPYKVYFPTRIRTIVQKRSLCVPFEASNHFVLYTV